MNRTTVGLLGRIEALVGALVVLLAFIAAGTFNWPVMTVGVTLFVTGQIMVGLSLIALPQPNLDQDSQTVRLAHN